MTKTSDAEIRTVENAIWSALKVEPAIKVPGHFNANIMRQIRGSLASQEDVPLFAGAAVFRFVAVSVFCAVLALALDLGTLSKFRGDLSAVMLYDATAGVTLAEIEILTR